MTKPEVLILQHAEWEKPGLILSDLEEINLPTQTLNISTFPISTKWPDWWSWEAPWAPPISTTTPVSRPR